MVKMARLLPRFVGIAFPDVSDSFLRDIEMGADGVLGSDLGKGNRLAESA